MDLGNEKILIKHRSNIGAQMKIIKKNRKPHRSQTKVKDKKLQRSPQLIKKKKYSFNEKESFQDNSEYAAGLSESSSSKGSVQNFGSFIRDSSSDSEQQQQCMSRKPSIIESPIFDKYHRYSQNIPEEKLPQLYQMMERAQQRINRIQNLDLRQHYGNKIQKRIVQRIISNVDSEFSLSEVFTHQSADELEKSPKDSKESKDSKDEDSKDSMSEIPFYINRQSPRSEEDMSRSQVQSRSLVLSEGEAQKVLQTVNPMVFMPDQLKNNNKLLRQKEIIKLINDGLYDTIVSDGSEQNTLVKRDQLNKIKKRYQFLYENDSADQYALELIQAEGWNNLYYDQEVFYCYIISIKNYIDQYMCLVFRKKVVFILGFIQLTLQNLIQLSAFSYLMSIVIILNIALFVYSNTEVEYSPRDFLLQRILMSIYYSEITIRILAYGIISDKQAFLRNFWNIYDVIILIFYTFHIYNPHEFIVDVTPFKMVQLLRLMGTIFKELNIVLTSIRMSMKYLLEGFMIVLFFSMFFTSSGVHMFRRLFNYRCMDLQTGIFNDQWQGCGYQQCSVGVCALSNKPPNIPTNFNQLNFAYQQILRTISMDDWTYPMYFLMRTFHTQVWLFFLLIIFVCGFFGFNLMIAILKTHYSMTTSKQMERIEVQESLDIQQLKKQGIYQKLQSLKTTIYQSIHVKMTQSKQFKQRQRYKLRTLSGAQKRKEMRESKKLRWYFRIPQFFLEFQFKMILLPNYLKLWQNPVQYDDEQWNQMKQKYTIIGMAHLSPQVKQNYEYESSSEVDLMVKFSSVVPQPPEQEQRRKMKFYYRKTNAIQMNIIKKMGQGLCRLPISRLHKRQLQLSRSGSSVSSQNNSQIFESSFPQKTSKLSSSSGDVPVIQKGTQTYILINGKYFNYEGVKRIINLPLIGSQLPKQKFDNDELYHMLRKNEIKKKVVKSKNWSGNDVIGLHLQNILKFNIITDSLNSKDLEIWIRGFYGYITIIRKHVYNLLHLRFTEMLFDLAIGINVLFMSLVGIIDLWIIKEVENIVCILLLIEVLLKIYAFSPKRYARKYTNIFEALIIVSNFIELILEANNINLDSKVSSVLRATKSILFYRCIKYNDYAVLVFAIAKKTYKSFIYLTFLMGFLILIYALIGMELFQDKFDQNSELGQLHSYDSVLKAWITVFNIITNDDWIGVNILGSNVGIYLPFIYCVSLMFIINYMTYGLMMAIMLDAFGKYLEEEEDNSDNEYIQRKAKQVDKVKKKLLDSDRLDQESSSQSSSEEEKKKKVLDIQVQDVYKLQQSVAVSNFTSNLKQDQLNLKIKVNQRVGIKGFQSKALITLIQSIKLLDKKIQRKNPKVYYGINCRNSFYIFQKSNPIRTILAVLVNNKIYQAFTEIVVCLSILSQILLTYYDFENDHNVYIEQQKVIWNSLILFDIITKCIAQGSIIDQGSYFDNTWKFVDFIYLNAYFINLLGLRIPILPFLLQLEFFRPMKLLYSFRAVMFVRVALTQSIYDISKVILIMLMVWLMFADFGIALYQNQFGFCDTKMNFYMGKVECEAQKREWVNFRHNFDNITIALPTLFVTATLDGWGEILQVAQNSNIADVGPTPYNNSIMTYIFFTVFVFVGSMFFLGFLTGVLYINFKANSKRLQNKYLTQQQSEFQKICKLMLKDKPRFSQPPRNHIRRLASLLVYHKQYQRVLFFVVIIDILCLLMYQEGASLEFEQNLNTVFHAITIVFLFQVGCELLTYGIYRYFDYRWRIFSFVIISIGAIDMGLDWKFNWFERYRVSGYSDPYYQLLRLFFAFRDFRIIFVFQGFQSLQRLLRVMSFAFPFLLKILFILLMVFFTYALFGCKLFGNIDKGQIMDDLINFQTFPNALLTLFKCASGDNWRTIMTDCMHHNPYCYEDPKYCGNYWAQPFFISFILLANYGLLNLFILGLIEQLEGFFKEQKSIIQTYIENIDHIKNVWCNYTSETNGEKMHTRHLANFLIDVGEPLGGVKDSNIWDVAKLASSFKIKADPYGYYTFNQLLYEMIRKGNKEEILKKGPQSKIRNFKLFDKEMSFRLAYQRKGKRIQRSNIGPQLNLKGNFNILQDYLFILIMFKSWQQYSMNILQKKQEISIDNSMQKSISINSSHLSQNDESDDKFDKVIHCVSESSDEEAQELDIYQVVQKNKSRKQNDDLNYKEGDILIIGSFQNRIDLMRSLKESRDQNQECQLSQVHIPQFNEFHVYNEESQSNINSIQIEEINPYRFESVSDESQYLKMQQININQFNSSNCNQE